MEISLSVIVPTFCREVVLVDMLSAVLEQMQTNDELLVIDQTPEHEPQTMRTLTSWVRGGRLRWYRKDHPGQVEAMNVGALLARNDCLVFLDDDVEPCANLLTSYRQAFAESDGAPAFCGQILQPWHDRPLDQVVDFETKFDPAYVFECDVLCLMEGNFAIRRHVFLNAGGMDENFSGCTYRHGTELAYRLATHVGHRPRFLPKASLRHLHASGGQRAYGAKDTWGHLGASVGDYYFALRCLSLAQCLKHSFNRLWRAPFNRNTAVRPWLVPSIIVREAIAWSRAWWLARFHPDSYIRPIAEYVDCKPWPLPSKSLRAEATTKLHASSDCDLGAWSKRP